MYLSLCSVSVIGPRNLREKNSNQDAVMHRFWNKNWCIAVCDGMGSKPLSHIGSTLACQSVCNVLKHCDFSLAEKGQYLLKIDYQQPFEHKGDTLKRYKYTLSFNVTAK